ncbi:MAG: protein phosphatase 2C domain-containing protein, partial [Candidatus Omnitrophica bacterium]|nr:protein phosphatase 2C domain-containing protein [Candidatus Omnitrophota bacterium]
IADPRLIKPGDTLKISIDKNYIAYKVKYGDSLSKLSLRYFGDETEWPKIYEDNKEIIGENPDLIYPGQELKINFAQDLAETNLSAEPPLMPQAPQAKPQPQPVAPIEKPVSTSKPSLDRNIFFGPLYALVTAIFAAIFLPILAISFKRRLQRSAPSIRAPPLDEQSALDLFMTIGLANNALQTGNLEDSRKLFTKALKIQPGNPEAEDGLAKAKAKIKERKSKKEEIDILAWISWVEHLYQRITGLKYARFQRKAEEILSAAQKLIDHGETASALDIMERLLNEIKAKESANADFAFLRQHIESILQLTKDDYNRKNNGTQENEPDFLDLIDAVVMEPAPEAPAFPETPPIIPEPTLQISSETNIGLKRKNNEDAYSVLQFDNEAGKPAVVIAAVFDGMGGHNGGEVASNEAKKAVEAYFTSRKDDLLALGPMLAQELGRDEAKAVISEVLKDALEQANQAIKLYAFHNKHLQLQGMGTTAVVALIIGGMMAVANVGDSRLYVLSDGDLSQITNDHSVVWDAPGKDLRFPENQALKEAARRDPLSNIIKRSLGGEDAAADVFFVEIRPGNRILLCSDGLSDLFSDATIARMLLIKEASGQIAKSLIAACLDAERVELPGPEKMAGKDNITVIVIDVLGENISVSSPVIGEIPPKIRQIIEFCADSRDRIMNTRPELVDTVDQVYGMTYPGFALSIIQSLSDHGYLGPQRRFCDLGSGNGF